MLKKTITYENYDGIEVTETLHFNLNTDEVFEMMGIEMDDEGKPKSPMADMDPKKVSVVMGKVSEIIKLAYGKRSEDGLEFEKSPELRRKFERSAAYNAIFEEVALSDDTSTAFLEAIMPKKILAEMKKIEAQQVKQGA